MDALAGAPATRQRPPLFLAFRLARRELRGGVRGLTAVLLCLALGVGVIAAVGSLRAAVDAGLAADGRRILGGDIEIDAGNAPIPDDVRHWLSDRGATLSNVTMMQDRCWSLLSGERILIELKAVDTAWPLVGEAVASPPRPIQAALGQQEGHYGLLADPLVLDRLGLENWRQNGPWENGDAYMSPAL